MNEQTRPGRESRPGPSGLGGFFDDDGEGGLNVTVSSGPYVENLPVGNMTVGEVRRRFADRFDIDPQSQAVVDGVEVGDEVLIRAGQALMFTRRAGEKGGSRWR